MEKTTVHVDKSLGFYYDDFDGYVCKCNSYNADSKRGWYGPAWRLTVNEWMTTINADSVGWLLEKKDPSVRYFALKDLLDKPEEDPLVQDARLQIMQTGIVCEILQKQQESVYLQSYPRFYTDKYKGLVWSLIALAELGAERNSQIEEQCEYLLGHSQESQDGGFSMHTAAKTGGGRISEVIPCLTGNMAFSLIRFGYLNDARLQKGIDWIVRFMRYNDGEEKEPQVAPYNHYEECWGSHTCHMGVVKSLKALAAVPTEKRTEEMEKSVQKAAEFMLMHHIHKRSHNLHRISKPGWLKFGFPLMYQTDALEILDILTSLGYRDPRMDEAVRAVIAKQDKSGRWHLENAYGSDRTLIPFERAGEPSKWITLRAMRVLKRYAQPD